jgi:glutamate/tyrosine decarboxylase-like PLP-dependent enzyme
VDSAARREAIGADRALGHEPMMVSATAGTTALVAFDPIDELADTCGDYGLWLHVDGASGG